jgi:3-oxosteroid 1-dehydrogenase
MAWDRIADVVVVGSGAAAFAAAVSAASAGSHVVMCEKANEPGGTTRLSGAITWIPNNALMNAQGIPDPRDMALKYMAKLAQPTCYDPDHSTLGLSANDHSLLCAFYDHGAEALAALEEAGALWMVANAAQVDYSAELAENMASTGRCLYPKAFLDPGAKYGSGPDMIAQLMAGADQLGVDLLLNHEVRRCIQGENGRVIGVGVARPDGELRLGARQGVVFGSGGFLHNPQLCHDFLRGPIFGGCAVPTNTGDFVRIGMELGADLGNMNNAWWSQVVLDMVLESRNVPWTIWMPGGDAMILVNRHGQRVVNEKIPYNERTQAHFHWDASAREYPNLLLMCIFDDATMRNATSYQNNALRQPVPMPHENPSWLISGATWEALAANVEARLMALSRHTANYHLADEFVPNLKATIERFNNFAKEGKDMDFRRGETPIEVAWGGARRKGNDGNSTMFPFSSAGPYHAVILGGGALDTKGGPRIDAMARVLNYAGNPIPGLYGAGNCAASPTGQGYWGAGATVGPALVFGYLAGKTVAQEQVRDISGFSSLATL